MKARFRKRAAVRLGELLRKFERRGPRLKFRCTSPDGVVRNIVSHFSIAVAFKAIDGFGGMPPAEKLDLRHDADLNQFYIGKELVTAEQVMAALAAADELEIRVGDERESRLGAVSRKTDRPRGMRRFSVDTTFRAFDSYRKRGA